MRIAIWHDLPSGGGFRAMCGQIRELQKREHQIAIWTPASTDNSALSDWMPRGIETHCIPFRPAGIPGYLDRRFDSALDALQYRIDALNEHAERACAEMHEWNADVVFAHPGWWFYTSPIGKFWSGASVLYLQEPFRRLHEAMPRNAWAAPRNVAGRRPWSRIGHAIRDWRYTQHNRIQIREEIDWAAAYDRVLVNSLYSREALLRVYGLEPFVCPLGVDHPVFAAAPLSAKEKKVVSLGEFTSHKGTALAVRAIGMIPENKRPPLEWFGNRVNERHAAEIGALAASLKVDLKLTHLASDEQLAEQISKASCMIYCPELEPFGLAPLEANLAGTAAVGVAEAGVRETIINGVNGSLVNGRDPAALAEAIMVYTEDLDFAKRAGLSARAHVIQNHSWRAAGEAIESQLRAAVEVHANKLAGRQLSSERQAS
ncbi:MAG: glycosyltransferase family 4 protein [Gemmatimonadaceae bacterium]